MIKNTKNYHKLMFGILVLVAIFSGFGVDHLIKNLKFIKDDEEFIGKKQNEIEQNEIEQNEIEQNDKQKINKYKESKTDISSDHVANCYVAAYIFLLLAICPFFMRTCEDEEMNVSNNDEYCNPKCDNKEISISAALLCSFISSILFIIPNIIVYQNNKIINAKIEKRNEIWEEEETPLMDNGLIIAGIVFSAILITLFVVSLFTKIDPSCELVGSYSTPLIM
jgi:hypothetical protein